MGDDNLLPTGMSSCHQKKWTPHPATLGGRSFSADGSIGQGVVSFPLAILEANRIARKMRLLSRQGSCTDAAGDQTSGCGSGNDSSPRDLQRLREFRNGMSVVTKRVLPLDLGPVIGGIYKKELHRLENQLRKVADWALETFGEPLFAPLQQDPLKDNLSQEYSRTWFYWASYLSLKRPSPRRQARIAKIEEKYAEVVEEDRRDIKAIFKNLNVVMRCEAHRRKAAVPTLCKLCNESVKLTDMANHSFKCFERKSVHRELDKVNKMIVRLRNKMSKLKAQIRMLS